MQRSIFGRVFVAISGGKRCAPLPTASSAPQSRPPALRSIDGGRQLGRPPLMLRGARSRNSRVPPPVARGGRCWPVFLRTANAPQAPRHACRTGPAQPLPTFPRHCRWPTRRPRAAARRLYALAAHFDFTRIDGFAGRVERVLKKRAAHSHLSSLTAISFMRTCLLKKCASPAGTRGRRLRSRCAGHGRCA